MRTSRQEKGREEAKNGEVPCFFPCDQGIVTGERFVGDCVIHHPVHCFLHFLENRSKSARVRAISYQRMDLESGSGGAEWWEYGKTYPPSILLGPRKFARTSHSVIERKLWEHASTRRPALQPLLNRLKA